jgi:SAM-dependent methyltransferase
MEDYIKANQELWDELTSIHELAESYDIVGFKSGKTTLRPIELRELGEVRGKSILHLQCHFGMDTMSWARLGARTTGVDYSQEAIVLARKLSAELNIKTDFLCCDIYDLPDILKEEFDIVFTSYGVLTWLPDLSRWAQTIEHFLKPGGVFYIVEGHPLLHVFDNSNKATDYKVEYSYFRQVEPTKWEPEGDYADKDARVGHPSYEWTFTLGDVVNSLIDAGLVIKFLHEFPLAAYQWSPFTEKVSKGLWHVKGDKVPMTFSLMAAKPLY